LFRDLRLDRSGYSYFADVIPALSVRRPTRKSAHFEHLLIKQKTAWQRCKRPHTFTFRFDGGVSKWPKDVDCKSIRLLPFTGSTPVSTTNLRLSQAKVKNALQSLGKGGLFMSALGHG
jgi:hypothetical protein